eukprot:TRINITY_DN1844_c0_g1_i2.p1 TRINITY_DN1844_c0_g1~~TRINITY_DN1844_c0_g1_i2.p1  ORF type:complete len:105 (-),score=17.59 TRINITY_DN1844_c0_g1_i2:333-647(-)
MQKTSTESIVFFRVDEHSFNLQSASCFRSVSSECTLCLLLRSSLILKLIKHVPILRTPSSDLLGCNFDWCQLNSLFVFWLFLLSETKNVCRSAGLDPQSGVPKL